MRPAKDIERAIAATLPTAFSSDAHLAQSAAKRNPGLRIGRQKDDDAFALLVRHNRLGASQKRFGFNDGLETCHKEGLYANDAYVNGVFTRRVRSGKDEHIASFVKRLYCKKCLGQSGEKRRHPKVEQTSAPPDGPLLPGPDHYEWKRFVSGQRRYLVGQDSVKFGGPATLRQIENWGPASVVVVAIVSIIGGNEYQLDSAILEVHSDLERFLCNMMQNMMFLEIII